MLIGSHILTSLLAYALDNTIAKKSPTNLLIKSKPQGVKIIYPAQGQRVSNDKNLTITGMSTDNSHTNCQVSIIVNNVRPYQHVIATGHNGTNDYSTWKFPLNPKYATLKPGLGNKATAKLTCYDTRTNLTKFYSVNFTSKPTNISIAQTQQYSKNSTKIINGNKKVTELSSILRKQQSSKLGNPSVSSPTGILPATNNKQNALDNFTTNKRITDTRNEASLKPESTVTSKQSGVKGNEKTNDPFVLTLPSITNYSSPSFLHSK
ncbi:MAG: hypothetical protein WBP64_09665 [Nitrososphaeraceae archaeon]